MWVIVRLCIMPFAGIGTYVDNEVRILSYCCCSTLRCNGIDICIIPRYGLSQPACNWYLYLCRCAV